MGVSLEELLQPHRIDIKKVKQFMFLFAKCEQCHLEDEIRLHSRCEPCPFQPKSNAYVVDGKTLKRVGCRAILKDMLGVKKHIDEVGRTDLFYFLNHPELGWRMPPLPELDFFGNSNCRHWVKHHYIHPHDDKHVIRVTDKEHQRFEAMGKRETIWLDILLSTRERNPLLEIPGVIPHYEMPLYYKHFKKEENGFVLKSMKNRLKYFTPHIRSYFYE